MTTPAKPFISVGALGDGFAPAARVLPPHGELAGRQLTLDLAGTDRLTVGDQVASWGRHQEVPCRITSVRPGVVLLSAIAGDVLTAFVLDLGLGLVTLVEGALPDEETRRESAWTRVQRGLEPTGVTVRIQHGRIDGSSAALHTATDELVGLRNRYDYSPTEAYEHIYLTEGLYAWRCLSGVEEGLADVDATHHIGIGDQLTLFVWREKIVPTMGVVLIDLAQLRTDGVIFGNAGFDDPALVSFPVGATATVLNRTAS